MLDVFYAYTEEYKLNDCFFTDKTNLYNMYKIKLHKTSKCLWPVYIHIFVVKCFFFFEVFINPLPKIHRSVLRRIKIDLLLFFRRLWRHLWEKLAITVKLCFKETRLKQGYDLPGYFFKKKTETINVLTIVVIHYFS